MSEIKLSHTELNTLVNITHTEGKRQGVMLAIDALRNPSFQKTFDIDRVEAEICAEALFTHIKEILK
jgi:hypothetical protein